MSHSDTFNPLAQYYSFKNQQEHPDWNLKVKKVAVILSSSRSGSSLIKSVLEKNDDFASLDGEIDPYLSLTGNGFPFSLPSDAIGELTNKEMLLNNLFQNLGIYSRELNSPDKIKEAFIRRFLIQFPELFAMDFPTEYRGKANYDKMVESLDRALLAITSEKITEETQICDRILSEVFTPEFLQFFDGYKNKEVIPFSARIKIEEPPFVIPSPYKRPFNTTDIETKTLLFKTPQDAYRPGMYEQLFPNAEIQYIHLTRDCAPAVNGLMDGWTSPTGFFAHDITKTTGQELNIGGYSEKSDTGKHWWKFDLPPNWQEFTDKPLEEVCLNQWMSAHQAILAYPNIALKIKLEDFLQNPQRETDKILNTLSLPTIRVEKLPVVMATEAPNPSRWLVKQEVISPLLERSEVKDLMQSLGYGAKKEII